MKSGGNGAGKVGGIRICIGASCLEPKARNPKPVARNPKPIPRNPKPVVRNPKPLPMPPQPLVQPKPMPVQPVKAAKPAGTVEAEKAKPASKPVKAKQDKAKKKKGKKKKTFISLLAPTMIARYQEIVGSNLRKKEQVGARWGEFGLRLYLQKRGLGGAYLQASADVGQIIGNRYFRTTKYVSVLGGVGFGAQIFDSFPLAFGVELQSGSAFTEREGRLWHVRASAALSTRLKIGRTFFNVDIIRGGATKFIGKNIHVKGEGCTNGSGGWFLGTGVALSL